MALTVLPACVKQAEEEEEEEAVEDDDDDDDDDDESEAVETIDEPGTSPALSPRQGATPVVCLSTMC